MKEKTIAVITGGASGMGMAIAAHLGTVCSVVYSEVNEKSMQRAKAQFTQLGVESYGFLCDSSDYEQMKAFADFAASKGRIKYVINCAGISPDSAIATKQNILKINALGTVNAVRVFHPLIVDGGVQINISSMGRLMAPLFGIDVNIFYPAFRTWNSESFISNLSALIPDSDKEKDFAYTVSKMFTTWFTKANTQRYASRGTRIISISPGHFNTRMMQEVSKAKPEIVAAMKKANPLGRWGEPEEMGKIIAFLCSPDAGYITGTDILIDGGFTTVNFVCKEDQISDNR